MRLQNVQQVWLQFKPAEKFVFFITGILAIIDCSLLLYKANATFDFLGYSVTLFAAAATIAGGLFYRISGRSEPIASALICTSAFILMTAAISLFNYLLLPLKYGTYDQLLVEIDAMFGYHWPSVMAWAAEHPLITDILGLAYMTSMVQLAALVIVLGMSARTYDMHVLLVSVTITAAISICFWGLFPTLGPTTVFELPDEVWVSVQPLVNAEYGAYLNQLTATGPGHLTPSEVRGLIAFPSYHAVMAFVAMYAARNVKILGPALFLLNLLILPSIFIHGGHHLVDLPAGFITFVIGTYLAKRLLEILDTNDAKVGAGPLTA